jgi:hypothetical protein
MPLILGIDLIIAEDVVALETVAVAQEVAFLVKTVDVEGLAGSVIAIEDLRDQVSKCMSGIWDIVNIRGTASCVFIFHFTTVQDGLA